MFMYSLEDAVITLGAARMWVQCLGFQGPRRQPDLSLDLISHMKPLKDRNHFETNHWKKNPLWKLFLAIILIHFFLWPHQLPKHGASTKLSPDREKTMLSPLWQTLPLLCNPLLHQGLQSRAPGSVWLPGLLPSSASDCCGSAQTRAGSEGKTKALRRKIRHKGTFSEWGLKQLQTQGTPGFTTATASWWLFIPCLTQSLCYREFNSFGDHGFKILKKQQRVAIYF